MTKLNEPLQCFIVYDKGNLKYYRGKGIWSEEADKAKMFKTKGAARGSISTCVRRSAWGGNKISSVPLEIITLDFTETGREPVMMEKSNDLYNNG